MTYNEEKSIDRAQHAYASDDVEVTRWTFEGNREVERVDGGYWVAARVWVADDEDDD